MFRSVIRSVEDPEKPYIGPNYWILKMMGLILGKNRLKNILYIIIHEIATFFVISQYMELYVIKSDMDQVLTNLKISMLSTICVFKSNTFIAWQKQWSEVIEYVSEADKYERINKDEKRGTIINGYTNYCRQIFNFYWSLLFMTSITTISTPLLKYLSSTTFREAIQNGTEPFPHIFSSWIPFDKGSSPGSWITVIYHILICAYGAGVVVAYDTSVVAIMVFFGGKSQLLRERCKTAFIDNDSNPSDKQISKTIRDLHNLHVLLLKYSRLFNSLLSPVMFLYIVMCSFMLCASAYQLTSTTNIAQKLFIAEYLIFGIAQLFLFCWHSNDVLAKHNDLMRGPYESKWWNVSVKHLRSLQILTGQLSIVHTFTAGPFTNLTLSTFVTILRGAYSYYAILKK